jgi:hypothetical protein
MWNTIGLARFLRRANAPTVAYSTPTVLYCSLGTRTGTVWQYHNACDVIFCQNWGLEKDSCDQLGEIIKYVFLRVNSRMYIIYGWYLAYYVWHVLRQAGTTLGTRVTRNKKSIFTPGNDCENDTSAEWRRLLLPMLAYRSAHQASQLRCWSQIVPPRGTFKQRNWEEGRSKIITSAGWSKHRRENSMCVSYAIGTWIQNIKLRNIRSKGKRKGTRIQKWNRYEQRRENNMWALYAIGGYTIQFRDFQGQSEA